VNRFLNIFSSTFTGTKKVGQGEGFGGNYIDLKSAPLLFRFHDLPGFCIADEFYQFRLLLTDIIEIFNIKI